MLDVLTICLPVFAMICFGVLLRHTGFINDVSHAFLSRFVYLFALPAMIFLAVARTDFNELFVPSIIVPSLLVTGAVMAAFWLVTPGLPRLLRGPVVLSPFFANTAYIGFPLASNAYEAEGLRYTAIINAFMLPVMVALGVSLLAAGSAGAGRGRALKTAVVNPVVIAAGVGVLFSGAAHYFALAGRVAESALLSSIVGIVLRTLRMLADTAAPLALVAVGAALRFSYVRGHLLLMAGCSAGKLVLTPLLTLLACRTLFPQMPPAALGTTVLLMGCPLSVSCYVISREMDTDGDFIAGLLVMTTAAACVTIPLWLAILP